MRSIFAALMMFAVVATASAGHNDNDRDSRYSDRSRTTHTEVRVQTVSHDTDSCSAHNRKHCNSCGRVVTYTERFWTNGYYKDVCVPASYEWRRDSCGRSIKVLVRPAYNQRVWIDGYWQTREVTKWIPSRGHHDDRRERYSRDDRRDSQSDRRYYGEYNRGGYYNNGSYYRH